MLLDTSSQHKHAQSGKFTLRTRILDMAMDVDHTEAAEGLSSSASVSFIDAEPRDSQRELSRLGMLTVAN